MVKSKHVAVFYQFLTATRDSKSTKGRIELDPVAERILEELAVSWKDEAPITVMHLMNSLDFIANSAAHRRLQALRKDGLIDLRLNENDHRVKFVVPTEKAFQYFDYLGRSMMAACNSEPQE